MSAPGETRRPSWSRQLKNIPVAAVLATGACAGQAQGDPITGPNACGPWEARASLTASQIAEYGVQIPESTKGTVVVEFGKLATAMAVARTNPDGTVSIAPLWWQIKDTDYYTLEVPFEPGTWVAGIVIGFNNDPDQIMPTTLSSNESTMPPPLTCQELRQSV